MPNWCQNELTFRGPTRQLETVLERLTTDTKLDFNRVVPCPAILFKVVAPIRHGPNGRVMLSTPPKEGEQYSFDHVEATPEQQDEIDQVLSETGHACWYDFCPAEWGTKWNASHPTYKLFKNVLTFWFDTAWSEPAGYYNAMLREVRAIAPDVTIHATARYEDDGFREQSTVIEPSTAKES